MDDFYTGQATGPQKCLAGSCIILYHLNKTVSFVVCKVIQPHLNKRWVCLLASAAAYATALLRAVAKYNPARIFEFINVAAAALDDALRPLQANFGRGQLKIQYCFCFLAVAGLASRICLTHSRASCFTFILEIGTDCFHSPGWVLHLVLQSNDVQWALCCFTVLAPRSLPDEHLSEHLQHPFPLEIWNLEPAYPQSTKILRPLGLRMFKALLFCSDSDTPPWHASSAIVALATARARTDRRTESDDQILLMLFVALTHSRNVVRSSRSISEHHQKRDQSMQAIRLAGIQEGEWAVCWCDPFSGRLNNKPAFCIILPQNKKLVWNGLNQFHYEIWVTKLLKGACYRTRAFHSLSGRYIKGPYLDPCDLSELRLLLYPEHAPTENSCSDVSELG